ncbi:MAG: hypothetical protein U0175_06720 [Caldilineaceae bacterium]
MPMIRFANFQSKHQRHTLLVPLFALSLLLLSSANMFAHPLGNFTINRYSRLEIAADKVQLVYVLDIAEIPTHRIRVEIDSDGDGQISATEEQRYLAQEATMLGQNFELRSGQRSLSLQNDAITLHFAEGQAGLPILRIEANYSAPLAENDGTQSLVYRDNNFAGQIGWQEVVVKPIGSISLLSNNASTTELSDQLRHYPTDLLTNPPAVNSATVEYSLAGGQAEKQANQETKPDTQLLNTPEAKESAIGKPTDGFADLIKTSALTPWTILLALLAAFGWGAAHAMSPGHGKTIVGAYLVGARGTIRHALFLGLTTTITHTAGVFALGFVTLFLANFVLPETLYPWLGVLSGLTIITLGLSLSWSRLKSGLGIKAMSAHDHTHGADENSALYHDHGDGYYHSHVVPNTGNGVSWRSLLALGVSGGLIPCPSALVLMLGAISLERVGFGLVLIFVFSLGLATVLSGIGILLVKARSFFDRLPVDGRVARLLPVASALFITLLGIGITWQAFVSLHLFEIQIASIAQIF